VSHRAARRAAGLVVLVALALGGTVAPARAQTAGSAPRTTDLRFPPGPPDEPPEGYRMSAAEVTRLAERIPAVREERAEHRGSYARPYLKGATRWQVSFHVPPRREGEPAEEIAQVIVNDRTKRVVEAWTGFQVIWPMARGYPGAFGRTVNAPYVWLPLCLLFLLPFLRPPWRLIHLDLAVLLAFGISYAYFNAAELGVSVPLVYPLLLYVLARMLLVARARGRPGGDAPRPPLRLLLGPEFLGIAIVFLVGFRIGLNVTDSNVIDVGYSGVIGADRVSEGTSPYGSFPPENGRGDTYGPLAYYAYVPFELAFPWSGRWDDLPAAHAAAIAFDVLAAGGLWLLGRRLRGPTLGLLLAYLWLTYPFTLLTANCNANDGLVAVLLIAFMLVVAAPLTRGAAVAAAGLTKFAPLALGPLAMTYRGGGRPGESAPAGLRRAPLVLLGLLLAAAVLLIPVATAAGGLERFYDRTLGFQAGRESPFSVWGYYRGLDGLQVAVTVGAALVAVAVAVVPRRRDVVGVAALGAAVLVAVQLTVDHWFYLYLVWFLPLVLVALLAPHEEPG